MASLTKLHDWNLSPREAVALQNEFTQSSTHSGADASIETVAGADISFNKFSETIYAAIVVTRLSDMTTVEEIGIKTENAVSLCARTFVVSRASCCA
jgi:deoxyribonuclease V